MLGVDYLRYSSDNQREESIIAQRRAIEEYAKKNDITVIREYIDEALSAKSDDRPSFLQMLDDIINGIISVDFVLVHKLDRFARNRYDSAIYRKRLKDAGVKIIAVAQPLDDSPESVILESMLEAMAEYYSLNLGRECFKGLKENALQAMHTGGTPPLGLDVDPKTKKYLLNEKEAVIVRFIFDSIRNGVSYTAVMNECNRKGFRTKKGQPFGKNSIYDILRNEKYCGQLAFHKRDNERNSHKFRPKEEWIIVDDALPVIIPKEEWMEVQEMMDKRKKALTAPRARGENPYILTGKIVCGECEKAYVGSNSRTKNGEGVYYFYTCSGRKRLKNCSNKAVPKQALEDCVINKIKEKFFNYETKSIEEKASDIEILYKNQQKDESEELVYLDKELAKLTKQINRFLDAFAEGVMDSAIVAPKLNSLSNEKKLLEARRAEIKAQIPTLTQKEIIDYLKSAKQALENENDYNQRRKLVNSYVDKIIIYSSEVEVIMKCNFGYNGSPKGYILLSETISKQKLRDNRRI